MAINSVFQRFSEIYDEVFIVTFPRIQDKKCCLKKYEEAARIIRDVYNQKNVDYTISGARTVEDSILEYEGSQKKMKNKHDKDILEKIMDMTVNKNSDNPQQ